MFLQLNKFDVLMHFLLQFEFVDCGKRIVTRAESVLNNLDHKKRVFFIWLVKKSLKSFQLITKCVLDRTKVENNLRC